MSDRARLWTLRLVMLAAGGTLLQTGQGCSENAANLFAQGVSSLLTSVINQFISTAIAELLGVPVTTGGRF